MTVFVVLHEDQWAVKTSNSDQAYRVFNTQYEAIECGKEIARNNRCELRIQDRSGHWHKCISYIYVLGFNKGYKAKAEKVRRAFIPGLTWGPEAEMLDLRYAVTSLMLRPHAQHGVLLRSYHHNSDGSIEYDVDMSGLIQGVVRIDLEDALEWLGHSTSLEVSSMFPPPAYDSCYRELISTERMMREQLLGKKIKPKSYRKAFVVKEGDILCVQRVG